MGSEVSVLTLVLTHYWFGEVVSRRKRVEYRRVCHFHNVRLAKLSHPAEVVFRRGYGGETARFELEGWVKVPREVMMREEQAAVEGDFVWALGVGKRLD